MSSGGSRVTRRTALGLLGTGAGAALLAACVPTAPPAPAPTSAPAAANGRRPGGTLRVGMIGDIPGVDGHVATFNGADTIWQGVHDTLTIFDQQGKVQPRLAESFDASADGKQVKLNLRKGVQFHTGREFTSADVKWNVLRVRDPKVNSAMRVISGWWTAIDTPDKYTVVLRSDEPRVGIFDFFDYLNILDQQTIEGPEANSKAVGTGPFAWGDWVQGDHLRLVKNANYWESGRPYLDAIQFSFLKDDQALVTQLEAGALDAADTPARRDAARLKSDPRYQLLVSQGGGGYVNISLNCTLPPTNNKQFRQAMHYALDRKRFVDVAMSGIAGTPSSIIFGPQSLAYDADRANRYTFDLDKARAALASSGITNAEIDLTTRTQDAAITQPLLEIWQGDLAKLGIKSTIQVIETAALTDLSRSVKYRGAVSIQTAYAQLEPANAFQIGQQWNYDSNSSGFKSETYATLAKAASSEPDTTKRKALYLQSDDLILDESFAFPAAPSPRFFLTTSKVHGLRYILREHPVYNDVWME